MPNNALNKKSPLMALAVFFGICFSAAAVGALATGHAPEYYRALALPGWAPPAWVFGPVWSVLYSFMAVAGFLVWRESGFQRSPALAMVFGLQLLTNSLWSWFFFYWQNTSLALLDIVVLDCLVAIMLSMYCSLSRVAAYLTAPYLAWILFASALNFQIWRLNPSA